MTMRAHGKRIIIFIALLSALFGLLLTRRSTVRNWAIQDTTRKILPISTTTSIIPSGWSDSCPLVASPVKFREDLFPRSYRQGVIRPRFRTARTQDSTPESSSPRTIDGRFLSDIHIVDPGIGSQDRVRDNDCENATVVEVDVDMDPVDNSDTEDILFGVATEIERIESAFTSFIYFIGGSKASLLAVVPPAANLRRREASLRSRGLNITLIESELPFTQRYFHLVRALREHVDLYRPKTKWVALIDDDTFFSSMHQIGARLASLTYTDYHYIGSLSEAQWQVEHFGRMAYGGAGVFMSVVMLDAVDEIYDYCASKALGPLDMGGDGRLGRCINTTDLGIGLTQWNELRQWDVRGNPDGVFESGKPIWSFHHWADSGWLNTNVIKMSAVALVAGEQSILRRWIFGRTGIGQDEKREFFVLHNGYSIVKYTLEPGVSEIDFGRTEYTWTEDPPGYERALGPFRTAHIDGVAKKRWKLRDATRLGPNVHQFYQHGEGNDKDVIEIVWVGT